MPFAPRSSFVWKLRSRSLELGARTLVMGILNVTPDSFSDGGHFYDAASAPERALDHAIHMLDHGADLLDTGGESTRPNATPVSTTEEQQRVLPVIEAVLRERPHTVISIDTFHAETARAAVAAGAEIVNDVSGLMWDDAMAAICAELRCGVVLMHARGTPQQWSTLPALDKAEIMPTITHGLEECLAKASAAGIAREAIVLDPGLGFGKRGDENYTVLARLDEMRHFDLPLLIGLSRKGFLAQTLATAPGLGQIYKELPAPADRLHATVAADVAAILAGAHIVRVHDVQAAAEAAAIADSILRRG